MLKQSKYNIILYHEGKRFIFNSINSALAEIDDSTYKLLQSLNNCDKNEKKYKQLISAGFIVDYNKNELYDFLETVSNNNIKNDSLDLTILLTIKCNFKCIYCYQNRNNYVNEDLQNLKSNIISMINRFKDINTLNVTWFGGEPTLKIKDLLEISNLLITYCKQNKIKYNPSIVTNGYLIDEKMLIQLMEVNINEYQITMDGPKDIHNNRRRHFIANINTFDRNINFIKLASKYNLILNLRINIDKSNIDYIKEFIDYLKPLYYKNMTIDFARVENFTKYCNKIKNHTFNTKEFSFHEIRLIKHLIKNKMVSNIMSYYPYATTNYCGATKANSLVINYNGDLYKCWCDIVDNKNFSSIQNINSNNQYYNRYMQDTKIETKCKKCKYFPLCLQGCKYNFYKTTQVECPTIKYNLKHYIKLVLSKEKNV